MAIPEASNKSPENPSQKRESMFSPRFRSVAAMAGWDEEALLIASLIVEDTPDRQLKHKKRSDLHSFKTPPTNSRRKRRAQRRSPASIPITVLDLDEGESKSKQVIVREGNEKKANSAIEENVAEKNRDSGDQRRSSASMPITVLDLDEDESKSKQVTVSEGIEKTEEKVVEKNKDSDEVKTKNGSDVPTSSAVIPCLDRLREELSCAICLEICYEPSTTPCGHSFCKKCLSSAADRCGKKCPKCRQLISNSRYCTVNTVLWNTIQLIFPQEVEARKANDAAAAASNTCEPPARGAPARNRSLVTRNRSIPALNSPESEIRNHRERNRSSRPSSGVVPSRQGVRVSTRAALPSQDEDAALALRLQREEFMEVFRAPNEGRNSVAVSRANLRAMASRAHNIRMRGQRE